MKIKDFEKKLDDVGITKKDFANIVGAAYNGIINWNSKGETPKWVDSWMDNYIEAKKYNIIKNTVLDIEEEK